MTNVIVDQVVRLVERPSFSTAPSVFAVSWMALICSRSNDERCAYVSALTADNDKCDICSIDIACDGGHVRTYFLFFSTSYLSWGQSVFVSVCLLVVRCLINIACWKRTILQRRRVEYRAQNPIRLLHTRLMLSNEREREINHVKKYVFFFFVAKCFLKNIIFTCIAVHPEGSPNASLLVASKANSFTISCGQLTRFDISAAAALIIFVTYIMYSFIKRTYCFHIRF